MSDPYSDDFFSAGPPQQRGPRPLLRFWVDKQELSGKSAEEGRPVYRLVDMVSITNPGSRDETPRLAEQKAREDDYVAWAYKKWKATQEQPTDGTPIETIPFLNIAQVEELKGINIKTLETLANPPEAAMSRMMGLRDLSKKAKTYMEAAKDTALLTKLQGELADRDRTIDLMKKQMEQMSRRFDELAEKVGA